MASLSAEQLITPLVLRYGRIEGKGAEGRPHRDLEQWQFTSQMEGFQCLSPQLKRVPGLISSAPAASLQKPFTPIKSN